MREASFLRAAESLTGAPVSYGNDADILINGDEIFPAYVGAIRDAEETVNLLTYAYWRGDIATEVADTLCEKASAGVECNVIVDAVGAAKMDRKLVKQDARRGRERVLLPPAQAVRGRRLQHRTHRKLLIVDGTTGFTGGVGIAEEWTGNAQDPDHWRDTHVRVRGPVVRGLQGAFAENWLECTGDVLAGDRYLPYIEELEDGGPMQVMRSSATVGDSNAEALVYLALAAAKRSIELTSAYFVPRPAFTEALVEAAERGVRHAHPRAGLAHRQGVRAHGRARRLRRAASSAGIEIYEYCPTMLHAKTLTVDGTWSSVGSVNFDNRSFQLHDEVTLCVQSERFAGSSTRCSSATWRTPSGSSPTSGRSARSRSAAARTSPSTHGASSERLPAPR